MILKRILEIQDEAGVDLTGLNQQSFKRKCLISTLSAVLESEIARTLDEDLQVWI
jgi:hypothetical protein